MRAHRWQRAAALAAQLLTLTWAIALAIVIGLAGWSRLTSPVILAGGSMDPAIPRGSVVAPQRVAASDLRPGDIVTVRAGNGVLVTHRITRLVELPSGPHVELQGDANPAPDPVLVPAAAVVGRIDVYLPVAGYLLAMLSMPIGLVSVVGLMTAMLLAIWMLEDAAATHPRPPRRTLESSRVPR